MTATAPDLPREAATSVATLVWELLMADGEQEPQLAQWEAARWESLPRAELLALQHELAHRRRRVDAALATASAEIDRRSQATDGAAGIARREGYSSPARQVAGTTGGSTAEAHRLIEVGKTLLNASRPERGDGMVGDGADGTGADGTGADGTGAECIGAEEPPRFRILAEAIREGRLSVDAANAISAMLTRVADVVETTRLVATEKDLVKRAMTLPYDRLTAAIRQCEAQLDRETARMREEARRASRYLNIFENRQGMVVIDGRLDVETAAPVKAAIDAMVGDALRRRRDGGVATRNQHHIGAEVAPTALEDDRTVGQIRADALADLAKHAMGCDAEDLPLPKTTVVVRIGLEELQSGVGTGEIDGFDEPVSAGAVRRMAADAEVIPLVLGAESEVLDLGRTKRLFSRPQRIALVERDGGCAWCHAPPSWCEAHHIRWWDRDRGPTDLSNGVMLCSSCHHRIHRDRWDIEVRDGTVWFTPPRAVDPTRTPVIGGRARFQYAQAA